MDFCESSGAQRWVQQHEKNGQVTVYNHNMGMGKKERHQRGIRKGLSSHGSHRNAILVCHAQSDALSCSQAWLQHPEQTQPGAGTDSQICHSFVGLRLLCTAGEMVKACSLCHNMEHQLQNPPHRQHLSRWRKTPLTIYFPDHSTQVFSTFLSTAFPKPNTEAAKSQNASTQLDF